MNGGRKDSQLAADWPELIRQVRARTPARILTGRAGSSYRTETQLELREAHAAARDAVRAELDVQAAFGGAFVQSWRLFEVTTGARTKDEYLLRPDLGRHFDDASRAEILRECSKSADLQIAIGDGLSVAAVSAQVPKLLPAVCERTNGRGWKLGRSFIIRHCRVGILNEIGGLLAPSVVVLLIGERPGLATAESLSAYMAYCPHSNHTDANRNLVSNIHARGLSTTEAAERIVELAARMMTERKSGCALETGERSSP